MNKHDNIISEFSEFLEAEKVYKEIYTCCPKAFLTPINRWDEFVKRVELLASSLEIPREAPSPIESFLSEDEYFSSDNIDIAIVRNDRYCPPFWHCLEFIKVIYVLRGKAQLFVADKIAEISEGNICIVSPNMNNALFSSNDEDIILNIIIKRSTFENAFFSLLIENNYLSDYFWNVVYDKGEMSAISFEKKDESNLAEIVLLLYKELRSEEPSNIMVKSYLMLMFGLVMRHYGVLEIHSENKKIYSDRTAHIIRYIEENKKDITLPQLAKYFKLSEGYLSRLIKRETGSSFYSILKKIRIQAGAQMLISSELSVEDIVEMIGYSDISRFYRNFKEIFGMTPNQYRLKNK